MPGFGPATSTLTITSFTNFDPETACGDTTLLRRITLVSSAGTLELAERGTVCFPGASFFTRARRAATRMAIRSGSISLGR